MSYFKTIEQILEEVGEDKHQNLSTTSLKFKKDIWEFFESFSESNQLNAIEFGTHKGQTTRLLSFIFKKVWSINLPNHFAEAEQLNKDRDNIQFVPFDLYQTDLDENFKHSPSNVFLIDAGHSFDNVISDFSRTLNLKTNPDFPIFYIFDDYGLIRDVHNAIEQLIRIGKLEKVCYIGHEPNHVFQEHPPKILNDYEGIICKLKK